MTAPEMTACDYAACTRPAVASFGGWWFCPRHVKTNAEDAAPQELSTAARTYSRTARACLRTSGHRPSMPSHLHCSVSGDLRPAGSLRPLLDVLNRNARQAGAA